MSVARLFAINALIRAAGAASGQLFAFLLAERFASGAGAWLVGALGACFFAAELLGAPVAGRRADLVGQRRVLRYGPAFGVVCGAASTLGAASQLSSVALAIVLVAARTSEGLSAACAVPTTLTLLSRATEGDAARRMRVMGLFEVTSLVAMVAGYALAGVTWDREGDRAFGLLSILYGIAWLLVGPARRARRPTRERAPTWTLVQSLTRERGNVAFGVAWLAVNAVVGVWIQQAPFLLKLPDRSPTQALVGGYSGSTIAIVFGVWGLVFFSGLVAWSFLGARVPRRRTLSLSLVAMFGIAVSLTLANHGAGAWAIALAALLVLVESGFTPAALAHLADLTRRHDTSRGAALGLYSFLLAAGQLLGNLLGAPIGARWRMDGILAMTAFLAITALVCVRRMPRVSHSL